MMKRYTSQQITEAIKFWTKILENKSPLLDSMVDEFGYGIVFNNVPIHITLKLLNTLFQHINSNMFSNSLVKWPFIVNDKICQQSNAICGYVHALISNIEKRRYEVVTKKTIDDGNELLPPYYAFSSNFISGNQCSLILVASILAHEMIHQYNYENEDEGSIRWNTVAYNKPYDAHGKNFEKYMDIANSTYGLNVVKHGYGDISQLNSDAIDALHSFAKDDYSNESSNNLNNIYGHRIISHTQDYSSIIEFM